MTACLVLLKCWIRIAGARNEHCDYSKRNKMQHGMQAVGVEPNELLVVVPVPRWLEFKRNIDWMHLDYV